MVLTHNGARLYLTAFCRITMVVISNPNKRDKASNVTQSNVRVVECYLRSWKQLGEHTVGTCILVRTHDLSIMQQGNSPRYDG